MTGDDIIRGIRDYLLERMQDREDVQHDGSKGGDYCIWWSHRVSNPKLKQQYLQYTITLTDGYATLTCCDLYSRTFEYANPAFPDNLLACLPVLTLRDGAALPQGGAVTPDTGDEQ